METRTIDDVLHYRAGTTPDRVVLTYLNFRADDSYTQQSLTFAELDRRIDAAARVLADRGPAGAPVLLVHPAGLEFLVAFFACLRAGLIAVPTSMPQGRRGAARLVALIRDAGATVATTQTASPGVARLAKLVPDLVVVTTDDLPDLVSDEASRREDRSCDVALLQYTSGSTSDPKGVVVTHDNVMHNQQAIARAFGHSESTTVVSWLPHFHDMGLACLLQAIHCGGHAVVFPPSQFLRSPARWLRAVSDFSATTSGAPDFAYALAADLSDDSLQGVDLRSWGVAFNGSEPLRATTIERFTTVHAPRGLRADAMLPCFGLAESTLLVTAKPLRTRPTVLQLDPTSLMAGVAVDAMGPDHLDVVSAGVACGQLVTVTDPSGEEVADGHVGEVWVAGGSVGDGYWGNEQATRETFRARLFGHQDTDFLRTGDLGFMRSKELFVTGRLREMIILRGTNHYPQDIEETARSAHADISVRAIVAFGDDDRTREWLTVVCETKRDAGPAAAVGEAVARAVTQAHGVTPRFVVVMPPGTVPFTTSGKPRRLACREGLRSGDLRPRQTLDFGAVTARALAGDVEGWVSSYLDRLQGSGSEPRTITGVSDPMAFLDSLQALTFCRDLEEVWQVRLDLPDLLELRSVEELLALVNARAGVDTVLPDRDEMDESGPFPLSPTQEGIWFLDRRWRSGVDIDSGWVIRRAFRVTGQTSPSELADALDTLVARHASLRTVVLDEERPRQVVRERTGPALRRWQTTVDPREVPPLPALDPRVGPLLQGDLFSTHDGAHILVLRVHHLAVDLHSLELLMRDLGSLLAGVRDLPDLPRASFRRHLLELGATSTRAHDDDYWTRAMQGASPAMGLHTADAPATEAVTRSTFTVDANTVAAVEELARSVGATPYMVYLTAFSLLVMQQSARSDVVVGSPVSLRTHARAWDVAGCLMQPGAVRVRAPGERPFRTLLAQVRRSVIDGLSHLDTSAEGLAKNLDWDRLATPEMFDAVLLWQQAGDDGLGLADVALGGAGTSGAVSRSRWELLPGEETAPRFALEMSLRPRGTTVVGTVACDGSVVSSQFAVSLSERFVSVLDLATWAPDAPISSAMRAPAAQVTRTRTWGSPAGGEGFAAPEHLYDAMLRWSRSQPDAVAVEYEQERLTYQELAQAADATATLLRDLPDGGEDRRGTVVAILVDDGPRLVTALFAVLATGAAFVCPGLRTPPDRVRTILAEARVVAAVVGDDIDPALREVVDRTGIPVVTSPGETGPLPAGTTRTRVRSVVPGAPALLADGRSPAFVAYTSGSSGRPKGVVQTHADVAAFLRWQARVFDLRPGRKLVSWSASTYDAAYCEIFGALCHGATLWTAPTTVRYDPPRLLHALDEADVSVWQVVPSFLAQVLREVRVTAAPTALTHVFSAGEILTPALAADVLELLPDTALHNLYGPTEAVLASCHRVTPADIRRAAIPLGTPIDGRRVLLLDDHDEPVPVGVVGRVHLASRQLAVGYLHAPALTADAFVPDPDTPSERMYRTGDLARWTAEGDLIFSGRDDGQVKVRGMRVELEECEAVLMRHSSVTVCAVRARGQGQDLRLEAHVVLNRESDHAELRAHMAAELPAHMVPGRFATTGTLPRTHTGKTDRAALPEIATITPAVRGFEGASTRDYVARMWSQVLGTEVGPDAEFFALGGQSVDAMRLTNRVRSTFAMDFSLQTLFEVPRLTEYAAAVHLARVNDSSDCADLDDHVRRVTAMSDHDVDRALADPLDPTYPGVDDPS